MNYNVLVRNFVNCIVWYGETGWHNGYREQATGRNTEESGFDYQYKKEFFSPTNRPDVTWDPPKLIFNEDRGHVNQ